MKLEDLKCKDKSEINLDDYLSFIKCIKNNMEHPEWLGDFTKNELESDDFNIWLYYKDNDILCSMMSIKSSEKSCSKLGINHNYKEVIDYGQMAVSPKYLGNGLQLKMLKYFDEYYKSVGYKYIATTIHPDNTFFINNILKDDFKLLDCKEFKRGKRNIYLKNLY